MEDSGSHGRNKDETTSDYCLATCVLNFYEIVVLIEFIPFTKSIVFTLAFT